MNICIIKKYVYRWDLMNAIKKSITHTVTLNNKICKCPIM